MPFVDNPYAQFSPAARVWEDANKIVKPAPPTLSDDAIFDLITSATPHNVAGPSNPTNPSSPNSPLYAQWLASPANPKHSGHAAWLAARPTKRDK
jgi:hypothetical protein